MEKLKISVVVNFYNMQREAKRTLFSLTEEYQRGISKEDYEVIVVDNGSSEPLDKSWVESLSPNFRYVYFDAVNPSPCLAINHAAQMSQNELLMVCIDGARILSPGILSLTRLAGRVSQHPFIYTMAMHIGSNTQNELLLEGYNQEIEDSLISEIDWQSNGYRLFTKSTVAKSSGAGFFSPLAESNCCALRRSDYFEFGGLNEGFISRGGGLANHDLFNKAHLSDQITPIMLLGEATFHQFHGGVATNVALENHPWAEFADEYKEVNAKQFELIYRPPLYLGEINEFSRPFLKH